MKKRLEEMDSRVAFHEMKFCAKLTGSGYSFLLPSFLVLFLGLAVSM